MPAPIPAPIARRRQQRRCEQADDDPDDGARLGAVADGLVAVLLHLDFAARVAIHHDGADDLVLVGVLAGLQRREVIGGCSRIGVRTDHEHEIVTFTAHYSSFCLSAVTTCPAVWFMDPRRWYVSDQHPPARPSPLAPPHAAHRDR